MKAYGGEGISPLFLTSILDAGKWSALRPGCFTPEETAPGTHWIGGWVGASVGLHAVEESKISCSCRESNPGRPVRSSSLCWLSYPGSEWWDMKEVEQSCRAVIWSLIPASVWRSWGRTRRISVRMRGIRAEIRTCYDEYKPEALLFEPAWSATPCSLVDIYQRLGRTSYSSTLETAA
jgi:hypothetical protein